MKLGIMQPYFLPYPGYFSLIKHTDLFIILDEVQFIRHGWIERNRILKQNTGWLYIKVPIIKDGRDTKINDIKINNTVNWKQTMISQLAVYKKIAPNYHSVMDLVKSIFKDHYEDIVSLNKTSLQEICQYLNIYTDIKVFSKMDLKIEGPREPDEWALHISKAVGAEEYWNPPGGKDLFKIKKYNDLNIRLKFQQLNFIPYDQKRNTFLPGLSIIDAMMFNNVTDVNKMLDEYEFV